MNGVRGWLIAGDILLVPVCASFCVLAILWYRRKPSRDRLVFAIGWACATMERLVQLVVVTSAWQFLGNTPTPDVSPAEYARLFVKQSLLQGVHAIPHLLIGAGFLWIVYNEFRNTLPTRPRPSEGRTDRTDPSKRYVPEREARI